jgi:hypothetical protein
VIDGISDTGFNVITNMSSSGTALAWLAPGTTLVSNT